MILLQPGLILTVIRHVLFDRAPKQAAMIGVDQMTQFMNHHIIHHFWRGKNDLPVNMNLLPVIVAATPHPFLGADGNLLGLHLYDPGVVEYPTADDFFRLLTVPLDEFVLNPLLALRPRNGLGKIDKPLPTTETDLHPLAANRDDLQGKFLTQKEKLVTVLKLFFLNDLIIAPGMIDAFLNPTHFFTNKLLDIAAGGPVGNVNLHVGPFVDLDGGCAPSGRTDKLVRYNTERALKEVLALFNFLRPSHCVGLSGKLG